MKRKKSLSSGQKKRRQRKIQVKTEKNHNVNREILFRKFGYPSPKIVTIELSISITRIPDFDESIIADWHAHHVRMRNLLFLKF